VIHSIKKILTVLSLFPISFLSVFIAARLFVYEPIQAEVCIDHRHCSNQCWNVCRRRRI